MTKKNLLKAYKRTYIKFELIKHCSIIHYPATCHNYLVSLELDGFVIWWDTACDREVLGSIPGSFNFFAMPILTPESAPKGVTNMNNNPV